MKKLGFILLFLISVCVQNSFAQKNGNSYSNTTGKYNWGLGLRLGDPAGFTAKKYLGNNSALEINLGKTNFNRDKKYFEDNFYNWYKDKYKYTSYSYQGYDATTPIALQVHYLIHKSINLDGAKGFYWYYGFGGMISHQKYTYYYTYFDNSRWYSNIQEEVTNIDFGADATIGLEYFLENTPISFFLDATLFIEIYDDFFATDVNGGIGARYNF